MKLFWDILNTAASGAVAVQILHFSERPTYLMLALGWFCLVSSLASLGTVIGAVEGFFKQARAGQ
jgi:hypothetical protein